jgi:hypothetical protein
MESIITYSDDELENNSVYETDNDKEYDFRKTELTQQVDNITDLVDEEEAPVNSAGDKSESEIYSDSSYYTVEPVDREKDWNEGTDLVYELS